MQSGLIAARVIGVDRGDPVAAYRRYGRRLAATFVGYFETARHATRRYHLAWRVLAAGAGSEHPFFAKGRRAILLPEGFSGLTAVERMDLGRADAVLFGPFLAACDEVAIATVRREWPFLARLAVAGEGVAHHGLRPAVPFFAALYAGGTRPAISRARLGAAIELALLGTLALLGPAPSTQPAQPGPSAPPERPAQRGPSAPPERPAQRGPSAPPERPAPPGPPASPATSPPRGIDWALTSTILAGDFLLAQASRLVAEAAPEVSWAFADWLGELAELRALRLDPGSGVAASAVYSALLEFPARIGAQLGGCPPATVRALREFGLRCGEVFLHAEDVLALRGERTRLDTTLEVMLAGRFSGIPDALGEPVDAAPPADPAVREPPPADPAVREPRRADPAALLADPALRAQAMATASQAGDRARRQALAAVADVPVPAARRILVEFAETAAVPVLADGDKTEDRLYRM